MPKASPGRPMINLPTCPSDNNPMPTKLIELIMNKLLFVLLSCFLILKNNYFFFLS